MLCLLKDHAVVRIRDHFFCADRGKAGFLSGKWGKTFLFLCVAGLRGEGPGFAPCRGHELMARE
jgi:hypothetical protein